MSYWLVWYCLPLLIGVAYVGGTIAVVFGIVLFAGYDQLDTLQLLLVAAVFFGFGLTLLWLMYGALRFAFHVKLASSSLEFTALTRRVSVPTQDVTAIKIDDRKGSRGLGTVEFQHGQGTVTTWELRQLPDLLARLQALNPRIVVSKAE